MKKSFLILLIICSCQKEKNKDINKSPFGIVVKFITAESFMDTIEAKKYINIERVYSKFIDKENTTAQKVWESKLMFSYNLSRDKKFTNHFGFYEYEFEETMNNDKSSILFTDKNKKASIESIEYLLELDSSGNWIIVDIIPKKRS
jgi:tRNA A37 methylthiotransferase MiaB